MIYGSAGGLSAAGNQLWHQDSTGIADEAEAGDQFGAALAAGDLDGDGDGDLAIGGPGEAFGSNAGAGAVNVIYGSATGLTSAANQLWHQNSAGIADGPDAGDAFAAALAAGDLDGDGDGDLLAGVPGESAGTNANAGLVHVIYGSAAGLSSAGSQRWNQNSSGIADKIEAGDRFGAALAAGDLNGDSRDDLGVGVPSEGIGTIAGAGAAQPDLRLRRRADGDRQPALAAGQRRDHRERRGRGLVRRRARRRRPERRLARRPRDRSARGDERGNPRRGPERDLRLSDRPGRDREPALELRTAPASSIRRRRATGSAPRSGRALAEFRLEAGP